MAERRNSAFLLHVRHPPITVSIAFVRGMLAGVRSRGLPYEPFLVSAGIALELLDQPSARVTAEQYVTLFTELTDQLDDEFLGFLSRQLRRGSFALILRSALGAETLDVAMRRVTRTFGLLQDDVTLELVQEGRLAGLAVRFTASLANQPNFFHELLLRVFWRVLAWLRGGSLPVERFDFAFESPPYAGNYGRVFPAPLRFGTACSAFWFDASNLDSAVRRDEAAMRKFITEMQANVVVPRGTDEVIARVREHLHGSQPMWPDLTATADALAMSASTLQRRLATEGTSFQTLKDDLRRDIAIFRLNTSAVPLVALAEELGFANSAAFQRAFKNWTGSAPGTYRRRNP
jgi:AraC-like DNA-binding protein